MSFGDREDSLWEALRPGFKPRIVNDPNRSFARRIVDPRGPYAPPAPATSPPSARATLARVMRKTPEVMVKVTGRKKGARHLAAHLDYIGRHGSVRLETRDGEEIDDKAGAERLAEDWSDSLYWRERASVSAVAMVFSMPAGTDAETVRQAVRETAERMIGDNHDYVMALHTDTPRPHVHLTVQAEGMDRSRFDPRREDLFRFREAFAEALRSRGIEAEATPRYSRGQGMAGASIALTKMRAKVLSGASRQVTDTDLRQAREAMQIALGKAEQPAFVAKAREKWADTRQRYETEASRLDRTGNQADRALAGEVRQFLRDRPTIETGPDRMLKEAQKRVRAAQERDTSRERTKLPLAPDKRPPPSRKR